MPACLVSTMMDTGDDAESVRNRFVLRKEAREATERLAQCTLEIERQLWKIREAQQEILILYVENLKLESNIESIDKFIAEHFH